MVDRILSVDDLFDVPAQTRNRLARNHGLFVVDRALGDGATDATAQIQSRINAAGSAGGGTVLIPDGTYMKGPALVIPSGVTVAGVGQGATRVKNISGAGAHVFATNQGTAAITIRDLTADGTNDGSHTTPLSVIYANGCSRSTFTGLTLTGGVRLYAWPDPLSGRGEGLELISHSNHNRISDIYAHGNRYDGIKLGGSHYNVISNLRAHNNGKGGLQFHSRMHSGDEENSTFNQATNVLVTHDTGDPGPGGSPHTNGVTFHNAEDNVVTNLTVYGPTRGVDEAETNLRNGIHGARFVTRQQMGELPDYWSNVSYTPFTGGATVHYSSGTRRQRLIIDSRGLVYDNNGAVTVVAP